MLPRRWLLRTVSGIALLVLSAPGARAVIVATGDGTENTSAPADDPGWANVGNRNGLTAVYLGNGWVVTANHVGVGSVVFGGVSYAASPSAGFRFQTAPGQLADLLVFKLETDPPLPALAIAATTPAPGAELVLIGNGRNRGAATSWNGISGWLWGAGGTKRWGTNQVSATPQDVTVGSTLSHAFWTDFTESPPAAVTPWEAQAAEGDSGAAAFVKNGSSWELAGVIFAIDMFVGQPASSALYGNHTFAVDLSFYRSAILDITTRPACSDGIDDDGDGFVDYPADPGCFDAASTSESPACQDGLDNDGDGGIDFDGGAAANHGIALGPPDPQCNKPYRTLETPNPCGLGAELVAVVPLLAWLRGRRRRRPV
jgi:hypothetical protein